MKLSISCQLVVKKVSRSCQEVVKKLSRNNVIINAPFEFEKVITMCINNKVFDAFTLHILISLLTSLFMQIIKLEMSSLMPLVKVLQLMCLLKLQLLLQCAIMHNYNVPSLCIC